MPELEEYTCFVCKGVFVSEPLSEKERAEDYEFNAPGEKYDPNSAVCVCEKCYEKMYPTTITIH